MENHGCVFASIEAYFQLVLRKVKDLQYLGQECDALQDVGMVGQEIQFRVDWLMFHKKMY